MTETAKTRAGAGNVWKRFLSLLLAFAMMLTFVPAPMGVTTAYADAPSTLYLTPNANWKNDGARFAAYFFGNGGSTWVSMTDTDGDGKYEAAVPAGDYANVIFCRMSGTAAANDWANKWNQTGDLVIPTDGKNWYTVDEGQWDSGSNGVWDTYTPAPVPPATQPSGYFVAGTSALCGSEWNASDPANELTLDTATGLCSIVYEDVPAGVHQFKVTDGSWTNSWPGANYTLNLAAVGDVTITFDPATKAVNAQTDAAQAPTTREVTVHVKNSSGWGSVYGYHWETANPNTWPGTAMTADGEHDGWFTMTVTANVSTAWKFIANNGSGSQTADLAMPADADEVWVDAGTGSVSAAAPEGWDPVEMLYLNAGGSGLWDQAGAWFAAYFFDNTASKSEWVKLTASAESGVYECEQPEYAYPNVIFVRMDAAKTDLSWDSKWNQTGDLALPTDDKNCYTITGWGDADGTWSVYSAPVTPPPPVASSYVVAGTDGLCGVNWDPSATANAMTLNTATGLYEKVYAGVADGDYELKVVKDGNWSTCWPAANYAFSVTEDGSTVTVTFDESTGTVNVVVTAPPAKDYWLVGFLNGADVGIAADAANMGSYKFENGKLTVTFAAADNYVQLKDADKAIYGTATYSENASAVFTKSGTEKMKVPGNAELTFTLTENADGSVNLSYTKKNTYDPNRKANLPGTFTTPNWDAASNQMSWDAAKGLYTYTFADVAAGTYFFKVAINGDWAENYGANGVKDGDNISVSVPSQQDVTVWYDDVSHRVVTSLDYLFTDGILLSGTGIPTTELTDPGLTGTYSAKLDMAAGTYSDLKIEWNGKSYQFDPLQLGSAKAVTFSFDPVTERFYHDAITMQGDLVYYDSKSLDYKSPYGAVAAGSSVSFSITTGLEVTGAELVVKGDGNYTFPMTEVPMPTGSNDKMWSCSASIPYLGEYDYYFVLYVGNSVGYYLDDDGYYGTGYFTTTLDASKAYDLVVYEAGFETPDWMKDAVIYQIFPDRFFDGDSTNNQAQTWARGEVNYEYVTDWYLWPENPEQEALAFPTPVQPGANTYTVHYSNPGSWTNVSAYVWSPEELGGWPGTKAVVNPGNAGWYSVTFTSDATALNLIFNGSGGQTSDLNGALTAANNEVWVTGSNTFSNTAPTGWVDAEITMPAPSTVEYPEQAFRGDGQWSNEIYGGDLKGITQKIDYLKGLGVNVIYLNPVFWSISNHRYDAVDYSQIDPILGTLGDFEELVAIAEQNDMHIILDGVFNHVSDDSVYFDRYYKFIGTENADGKKTLGAYPYWAFVYDRMNDFGVSQAQAEADAKAYFTTNYGIEDYSYTEWFAVSRTTMNTADNIGWRAGKPVYSYEGWWGYDSMPVIYSTNGSEYQTGNWAAQVIGDLSDDVTSINEYWIGKGMDGWRLDVANEVSDETWQNFRDSVKALNSDAVIIGEIWSDATYYLMGDMYDSVMNYEFRRAVTGFALEKKYDTNVNVIDDDYTAADAAADMERLRERYPEEAFYAMMNLVDSHDTSRVLSLLDGVLDDRKQKDPDSAFPTYEGTSDRAKALQYMVAFLQFTYGGAPTIYYGDEIGMVGADDPDDRRTFEWGKGNKELVEWYALMGQIREEYAAQLTTGSIDLLDTANTEVLGFKRGDGSTALIALANRADSAQSVELDLAALGMAGRSRASLKLVDVITGEEFDVDANNKAVVTVDPVTGALLKIGTAADKETLDADRAAALVSAYDPAYIVGERTVSAGEVTFEGHTHDWYTEYISTSAKHWHECRTCHVKKDEADHSFAEQNGKLVCSVCGFTKGSVERAPLTGDAAPVALYAGLLMVALATGMAVLPKKRRG